MTASEFDNYLYDMADLTREQHVRLINVILEHYRYNYDHPDKSVAWRLKQAVQLLKDKTRTATVAVQ